MADDNKRCRPLVRLTLTRHFPRTCLDPEPGIPPVQQLHPSRHWALDALGLAAAGEEAALESKHGFPTFLVDGCTDGEQTVRVARIRVPRSISAANNTLGRGFLDNLKVVGELRAGLIRRLGQLINCPQLRASARAIVFASKICPLKSVS
jgi:hypothetical protein